VAVLFFSFDHNISILKQTEINGTAHEVMVRGSVFCIFNVQAGGTRITTW
jgi:hypothetical protein